MGVKYFDYNKDIKKDIESGLVRGLLQGSEMLATDIQKETPVISGNLKQSIKPTGTVSKTPTGYITEVNTPVVYAAFVEYGGGTRDGRQISFKPRAMFRKGASNAKSKIESIILNNLK